MLGTSCCRLRGVVQFVSFSRRDCSGCLSCLGLFQIVFFVVDVVYFFCEVEVGF